MRLIVFLVRNEVGEEIVQGDFSSFGVISLGDSTEEVPLDTVKTLSLPQGSLDAFDLKGQTALAELLQQDSNVGGYLIKLIEAAAQETVTAKK